MPGQLIAKYPATERTSSRLLHLDATKGKISHHHFRDLPRLLDPKDLLVFNDTKVIPARLFGTKPSGGKVEILLERMLDDRLALLQLRSSRALQPGTRICLKNPGKPLSYRIEVKGRQDAFYVVRFPAPGVLSIFNTLGHIPLPPYIDRQEALSDRQRYQTVFARKSGAVAAPTAGLHFDKPLLADISAYGTQSVKLTLHVGAGTFQPVRVKNIEEHKMHAEFITVGADVCGAVNRCRARGGRVIAVGTTSVRALESASTRGVIEAFAGDSRIFIYPGYAFQSVDAMITNFHLSESTLMMLVSAFAGTRQIQRAYAEAIQQQYRFFSYGDAMLITR